MDNNKYELTIKFDGLNEENSSEQTAKNESDRVFNAVANVAKSQVIKPFIESVTEIYFNNLQTSTGSTQLVERQRFLMSGVKQGINLYMAAQGGIAFAGAIGMNSFAGGAIGIGLYLGNTILDLIVRANELNNQKKIEDVNIEYQRTRMGIANNKSRTGA